MLQHYSGKETPLSVKQERKKKCIIGDSYNAGLHVDGISISVVCN